MGVILKNKFIKNREKINKNNYIQLKMLGNKHVLKFTGANP